MNASKTQKRSGQALEEREKRSRKEQVDEHLCLQCGRALSRGSQWIKDRHWERHHNGNIDVEESTFTYYNFIF